ncbi:MAG: hypothetical protein GXX84_18170 [Acidobacteria bacterium]|nr:hypothetical protein [Acidobacteriota bacterium]
MSLTASISHLPHLPSPILTAYIDINPGNPRNQSTPRGYMKWLKSTGRALSEELPPSERKAFETQLDRISRHLKTADPGSRGLVLFAGPQTWEEIPLQVEVRDELHWGKPSLQQMAWVLDEHRLRGAVLIDGSGARFLRFFLGTIAEDPPLEFTLDISSWRMPHMVKPSTSPVAKRAGIERDRVAARIEEQRKRFLKRLSDRIADWANEGQIRPVLLVGEAEEIEFVAQSMPEDLRDRIATLPKVLTRISSGEINKRLQPLLTSWEREYEAALVKDLISNEGSSHQAVTGLDETLDQIQKGNVRELVVARGLTGSVNQCVNCGWIDASGGPVCPVCGSGRQVRALRTVIPELALSQSAAIEIVAGKAASDLRTAGGIGAWLRTPMVASKGRKVS